MITKCSSVILARKKFSQFESADLDDDSLYIVGYETIDGELDNVKISVSDLISKIQEDKSCVVSTIGGDCPVYIIGDDDAISVFSCGGLQNVICFDYSKTGSYIQLDNISSTLWTTEGTTSTLHITFQNFPVGQKVVIFLKDVLKNITIGNTAIIKLHGIGVDDKNRLYPDASCPFCTGEKIDESKTIGTKESEDEKDMFLQICQTYGYDGEYAVKVSKFLI